MTRQCEALEDFDGEQPEDLSFKAGEVLTIIRVRADGWMKAENTQGERGWVPSTFVKEQFGGIGANLAADDVEKEHYKEVKKKGAAVEKADTATEERGDDESEEEEEEEEESEEELEDEEEEETDGESQVSPPSAQHYEALVDFDGGEPEDLSFKAGELLTVIKIRVDGWMEAENIQGERGWVPSNYLKAREDVELHQSEKRLKTCGDEEQDDDKDESPRNTQSVKLLWKNFKTAVKKTSATNVLHAMGAVPAGYSKLATSEDPGAQSNLPFCDKKKQKRKAKKESKKKGKRETKKEGKNLADTDTMNKDLATKLSVSEVPSKDLYFNSDTHMHQKYETLVDFDGEEPEDLSFKAGEVLTIIAIRTDGWMKAQNIKGERGWVPSTFVKSFVQAQEDGGILQSGN